MYLPLTTTFAIFTGGIIKGILDFVATKRKNNEAQKQRSENVGVLLASGLIAGEALMGLVVAMFAVGGIFLFELFSFFKNPVFLLGFVVIIIVALMLIIIPLKNAGRPDEPAPPSVGH
jgi:magnesium-transporting ATPase (P-type)